MLPTPRNIIIFVVIGLVLFSAYFFYSRSQSQDTPSLVSSQPLTTTTNPASTTQDNEIAQSFLSLLLNVKTIKLNDGIFSDIAFTSLHDSSIVLVPDGNEGRPNPFAPLGVENVATPVSNINTPASQTPATTTTNKP